MLALVEEWGRMTWDQLVPAPIGSLTLFLLVAGYALTVWYVAAIVLWRDRQRTLGIVAYGLVIVSCLNALAAYAYTPNLIDARIRAGDPHGALVIGQRWISINGLVNGVVIGLLLVTAVLMFAKRHFATFLLCMAAFASFTAAGRVYDHYNVVLLAELFNRPVPSSYLSEEVYSALAAAGAFTLMALYLALRDVLVALFYLALTRRWHWPRFPMLHFSPERVVEQRSSDLVQRYLQQQSMGLGHRTYRLMDSDVQPSPRQSYPIKRWREQQRYWGGRLWWRYSMLPVMLYCAQFWGPPMPPEYRYYELHEFYY
jgi:hypothetical protein